MMAIPSPLSTRGMSTDPVYLRSPGVLARWSFLITGSFVIGSYFKAILIVPCALLSSFYSLGYIPDQKEF